MWCAEGLRAVKLPDVQQLRFANPVIESEFRRALEVLALSPRLAEEGGVACTSRATASGRCRSATWSRPRSGRRATGSCSAEKEKPYLQGWAMVENPTDEDWAGVKMALVSGPADLASRWTCTTRCTSPGRPSSRNCSPRSGRSTYRGGFGNGRQR